MSNIDPAYVTRCVEQIAVLQELSDRFAALEGLLPKATVMMAQNRLTHLIHDLEREVDEAIDACIDPDCEGGCGRS